MHTLQLVTLCVLVASLCVQSLPQSDSVKRFLDVVKQQRRSAELPTEEEIKKRQTGTKVSNTGSGVVYIRWGRTECAGDATVLFTGQVGGSHYANAGGGANYLCLHDRPQWGNTDAGQSSSQIFGAEYKIGGNAFSLANNGGATLMNHDVPCVACYASTRAAKVMIPGRRECPDQWTSEFRGYLVSAANSHQKTSYECMDETPEVLPSGHASINDGALFYPVDAVCGTLQCPRYSHLRKVTCVLCTK